MKDVACSGSRARGVEVPRRLGGIRVVSGQFGATMRAGGCDATLVKCEYSLTPNDCCFVIHLATRRQVCNLINLPQNLNVEFVFRDKLCYTEVVHLCVFEVKVYFLCLMKYHAM